MGRPWRNVSKMNHPKTASNNQYLAAVLDGLSDAIMAMDRRHKIIEWDKGAETLFGFRREKALGNSLDAIIGGAGRTRSGRTAQKERA